MDTEIDNADNLLTFQQRASWCIDQAGGPAIVAKKISEMRNRPVYASMFHNILRPQGAPPKSNLYNDELALFAGVNPEWLRTGKGERSRRASESPAAMAFIATFKMLDAQSAINEDDIAVLRVVMERLAKIKL